MKKDWHDEAWEDYIYWQSQDKKTLRKINALIKSIDRNGYSCEGAAGTPDRRSGGILEREDR